jgi:hypothetical protein
MNRTPSHHSSPSPSSRIPSPSGFARPDRPRHTPAVLLAFILVAMLAFALLPALAAPQASSPLPASRDPAPIRIGTYDSRAVAVAFVRSDLSARQMDELMRQHSEAKKQGDTKRIKQLEAQGESMQVRKHLQGFSTAPVEDVLDKVRDKLPGVAQRKNVAVITRQADYHDPAVEVVDVTDELVALFNPDQQTLKIIVDLRKQKPLPIEEVAKMPANK